MFMLLALMAPIPFAVPETSTFKDWIVVCDNGLKCSALALPRDEELKDRGDVGLQIEIGAGASDAPTVLFTGSFMVDPEVPSEFRLFVDGVEMPQQLGDDYMFSGDTFALVRALAAARNADFRDRNGEVQATVPLAGSSAALRLIDERQKRVGTTAAIVAKGEKPMTATLRELPSIGVSPASRKPPVLLDDEQQAAVKAAVNRDNDIALCDDIVPSPPTFERLDDQTSIGIIPCFLAAYQSVDAVVLIDEEGHWRFPEIETTFLDRDVVAKSVTLIDADFEPGARFLWESVRGRGLADCGRTSAWQWDESAFRLAYHAQLDSCRGTLARLTHWRTRQSEDYFAGQ